MPAIKVVFTGCRHLLPLLFFIPFFSGGPAYALQKKVATGATPGWVKKIRYEPDKKPDSKDISSGYYLALYEEQHNMLQKTVYRHIIRCIISTAGVQNAAEISVTYDPAYEKPVFHKIVIWRDGKAINKLDASAFKVLQNETSLSDFIYSGTYTAYLILDDVRKGDRIEFAYSVTGAN